jgi:hypothetical protein
MRQGDDTNDARLALLEEHRRTVLAQLERTASNLDQIEAKIEYYRKRLERR